MQAKRWLIIIFQVRLATFILFKIRSGWGIIYPCGNLRAKGNWELMWLEPTTL